MAVLGVVSTLMNQPTSNITSTSTDSSKSKSKSSSDQYTDARVALAAGIGALRSSTDLVHGIAIPIPVPIPLVSEPKAESVESPVTTTGTIGTRTVSTDIAMDVCAGELGADHTNRHGYKCIIALLSLTFDSVSRKQRNTGAV